MAGTHHTAEPTVETIEHLDFAHEQPCTREGCETGQIARWRVHTPTLCPCVDFWCEPCRTLWRQMVTQWGGRTARVYCSECGAQIRTTFGEAGPLVIIEPIS